MSNKRKKYAWKLLALALTLALSSTSAVWAQDSFGPASCGSGSCGMGGSSQSGSCQSGHCQLFHCPKTKFCVEGPPCICVMQGCAKPVINPCTQPFWGYYQPCWTPWPGGPDWSHCPVQPPASLVFPPPGPQVPGSRVPNIGPNAPSRVPEPDGTLPYPRMTDR